MKEIFVHFVDIMGFMMFLILYPIIIVVLIISEKTKMTKN